MGDRPETVRVVGRDSLNDFRARQHGNGLARPIHEGCDLIARDVEDDESSRECENGRIVEPAG
jgi:hypothetical protein